MGLTCTLTGTIYRDDGAVATGAVVTFTLCAPRNTHWTSNNRVVLRAPLTATTDGSGNFSQVVARNDQLTPDGTYWKVECADAALLKHIAANADTLDVIVAPDLDASAQVFSGLDDPDADWVAHGHAQTLTAAEKLQAATNLGLNLSASQLLGQASIGGTGLPVAVTLGTNLAMSGTTLNVTGGGTVTSVAQSFTGGLISVAGSPITASGTLALTVAGTSGGIPYFSSGTTWATSAALAASALVVGGGAGAAPATVTTGANVLTALGVAVGSAGAFVTFDGAGGTPLSMVGTNISGTAASLTAGLVSSIGNLTGDVTSSNRATTLATVNGNVGSFTNASVTVNAKGLVTAASSGTSAVTSITGTANEITVTGTTTPTLSLPSALTFTGKTVTGGTFSSGAFNGTVGATTPDTVAGTTGTFSGNVSTTGSGAQIFTTGLSGSIYTTGGAAPIYTTGAPIYTDGVGCYIQTRDTFKLNGGTFITTLSHAATANRAIALPDAAGTLLLSNGSGANLTALNASNISSGTLAAARGGTGVSNTGTITLGGNLVTTGAFNTTFAQAATTTVTLPSTSATMARTDAAQTFTGIQSMTSPDITTSITTPSTSFTAFAGATTLLTIGGTGASASLFAPSTLDATSSTTGAIRTSGGISAAKSLNIGTTGTFGGAVSSVGVGSSGNISATGSAGVYAEDGFYLGVAPVAQIIKNGGNTLFSYQGTLNLGVYGGAVTGTLTNAGALSVATGTFTSTTSLLLGTAGSAVGNIGFRNATSGTTTLAPATGALGTGTVTLPLTGTLAISSGANTFTGVQSMTSPDITTSITTPSTTFAVANATATTVNAFGAATAINMGAATATFKLGTATSTGTATPATLDCGGTYADTVTSSKAKWKLYSDGTAINTYGIGISAGKFNFFTANLAAYSWLVADAEKANLSSVGFFTLQGGLAATTGAFSSTLAVTGATTLSAALITTPEALAPALNAGAACGVTTVASGFALNGVNALTLANGTNGQIKTIVCTAVTAAGTATLTPTTCTGYTTVAFTAAGQTLTLQYFTTGGWHILSVRGAVPA